MNGVKVEQEDVKGGDAVSGYAAGREDLSARFRGLKGNEQIELHEMH